MSSEQNLTPTWTQTPRGVCTRPRGAPPPAAAFSAVLDSPRVSASLR